MFKIILFSLTTRISGVGRSLICGRHINTGASDFFNLKYQNPELTEDDLKY